MLMKTITAFLLIFIVSSCATPKKTVTKTPIPKTIAEKAEKDLAPIENEQHFWLTFEPGMSHLNQINKTTIQKIVKQIKKDRRQLDAIKILTWADKEYPTKNERVSIFDSTLADERIKEIKIFMEKKFDRPENIVSHNMATRPSSWSRLLKDNDFKLKESFEKRGLVTTEKSEDSSSNTKASKTIIIIDYVE